MTKHMLLDPLGWHDDVDKYLEIYRLDQGRTTAPPSTSGLNATVFNGGNVRATAARTGKVLDQINARETVPLLKRSKDGVWYQITTPRGITGWVHRSLLTIA